MREEDVRFMRIALGLARRGAGLVNPNPMVGAVVVKDGEVIGVGWHQRFGGKHAEVNAIEDARRKGHDVKGATMYVTLEPCSHWGKQPPCADRIIKEGLERVVVAMVDPNPVVSGRGIEKLRSAGIEVEVGVLEEEARKLNEVFIKYVTTGMPFVSIKLALTLDGFIATETGSSQWITGEAARARVQELRKMHMAIMVGSGTVLRDNPRLNCRLDNCPERVKVVLDRSGRVAEEVRRGRRFNLFNDGRAIFFTERPGLFEGVGEAYPIIEPGRILRKLGELGIDSVLIEGGRIACEFLAFADKFYLFYGPKLFGRGIKPFECLKVEDANKAPPLRVESIERIGESFLVTAYPGGRDVQWNR
ncbi:bifunctional diaminohydroxyphosphoribosylaminopyrimidine deaminase/5-amino-6-(5-phosphoribosylamino)uracil reductase RibD [Thermococcus sp. 21S7]|uniref:bifunctional diaminohydroxyphosphoribosylaminopyrimidine deaminase/5-amino-6-(5-phosphoribosylamino)uracil reductase RibD n=1 Tax=Thermococcus sp. 21S7 TaxID=1638221 RepID=UPI001439D8F8|nr:bifunctional diaminohydroxyphosphoribosylaminopyrimidine deaminase/5-amino-6-(5-phosphoribosylamino)uracil reductase RibD [Thermococcus sp. 21S7]NJE61100.1 bifunctional diaminohydroxyphosphoribosylaminopyrimidine deaminase/5-amino-6-(5-phosphoribosylamino)uracil reductase RibD [Thermococcus sp. 21S7]